MKSKTLTTFIHTLLVSLTLVAAVSCNERVPANRPLITAGSNTEGPDPVDPVIATRPDGEVYMKNNFCGCKDTVNILIPDATCNTFCSGKNTGGQERLYFNTSVSANIELGELKNTVNWCTKDVGSVDVNANGCRMVFRAKVDDDNIEEIPLAISLASGSTGNSFYAVISDLPSDRTYVATLVATTDFGSYKSDSIQVRKVSAGTGPIDPGPIALQPVTQYACINRATDSTDAELYIKNNLLHFFFVEQMRPDPLPPGFRAAFCHDVLSTGKLDDSAEFQRLFEEPNAFSLWRIDDTRMLNLKNAANSGMGWSDNIDAEDIIVQKLTALGATASTSRFFGKLNISSGPSMSTSGNSSNATAALGWYMRIFINQTNNNLAVCPKAADYAGTNKLFRAVGEVVQVDTEGVYLARREVLTYTDPADNTVKCMDDDFLIVPEAKLRAAWFYKQNGASIRPSNDTAGELAIKNNTMLFYYPFRPNDPTVRKPDQKLYTVVTPAQANTTNSICSNADDGGVPQTPDSTSITDSIPPHDKRFGCIPVSQ